MIAISSDVDDVFVGETMAASESKDFDKPRSQSYDTGRKYGESKVAFAEDVEERTHPFEFTNHADVMRVA